MKKGTISKVREYYLDSRNDIFVEALRDFFDQPDLGRGGQLETSDKEEDLFMEWLFFDYKLKNGKTMLEDFYDTNPFNLSKEELSVYKDLQDNVYGLFEVDQVKLGESLTLKNIQTEKEYSVNEFSGSLEANKGDLITGRVAKIGQHFELVGSNGLLLPFKFSKDFLNMLGENENQIMSPKLIRNLILKPYENNEDNFDDLNEQELVKILEKGNLSKEELDKLVETMQEKGLSGSIMQVDPDDPDSKDAVDYVNYHEKLPKDYKSKKQIEKAKITLFEKNVDLEKLKKAILILAHSGELESLTALQKYSENPNQKLTVWISTAIGECQMFLKSDLLDRPRIKITKLKDKK